MKPALQSIIIFFIFNSLHAQFSQQWINNFCCFDSLGPHTFSYPLGKELKQDTLVLAFFEDYFLNFKVINTNTGNDIQIITFQSDTIQSPFYYGGGTLKIANNYITSAVKYNFNNGQFKLFHSSVSNNLSQNWSDEIITVNGKISKPLSNISETAFYTCIVSDSIRLFKYSVGGSLQWTASFPAHNTSSLKLPELFLNAADEVTILNFAGDTIGVNSYVHLIKVNGINGAMVLDSVYLNSAGNYHIPEQTNDTLKIVFINDSAFTISFIDINLVSFNVTREFNSNILCWTELTKYSIDPMNANYYLKSNDNLYGFSSHDSLLINTTLTSEKHGEYDAGNITFDSLNLFLAYSYFNSINSPPNNDIKIQKINKITGTIESASEYNDIRNTNENYLDQCMIGNSFYVIFANNFDNFAILQEETQFGVIKYINQTQDVNFLGDNNSIGLFPNPCSSLLSVKLNQPAENVEYFIYDITGRISSKGKMIGDSIIDLEYIENGVYTILFKFKNGNFSANRIIKI